LLQTSKLKDRGLYLAFIKIKAVMPTCLDRVKRAVEGEAILNKQMVKFYKLHVLLCNSDLINSQMFVHRWIYAGLGNKDMQPCLSMDKRCGKWNIFARS